MQTASTEQIAIISAMFHTNCLSIELENDREDFWVNLGQFIGWGRFRNRDRVFDRPGRIYHTWHRYTKATERLEVIPFTAAPPPYEPRTTEVTFLLVEVRPAGSEPPRPIVFSSNVLWRKREALESLLKENAYLECLKDFC